MMIYVNKGNKLYLNLGNIVLALIHMYLISILTFEFKDTTLSIIYQECKIILLLLIYYNVEFKYKYFSVYLFNVSYHTVYI